MFGKTIMGNEEENPTRTKTSELPLRKVFFINNQQIG